MFTRVVEIVAKTGKGREVCNTVHDKILPILRNQPGFVDEIVLTSTTEPDRLLALSFWKTREDAERYNREQYPHINDLLQHLLISAPKLQTFDVDTSTTHRIAAGKAA